MNVGKTLFAQVMEFVPWKTFGRIVERHKGDAGVRTLGCADLFRVMAFAQLTWRESLRDIEACLAANQTKLFHMGIKSPPARSTLADALERARLAHLPCTGSAADRARQGAVRPRAFGARTRRQCLCAGLHHDRSVPEPVRLGAVSHRPRRPSSCTRCWTCAARSRRSFTSATASCTTSMCSTSCPLRPGPST